MRQGPTAARPLRRLPGWVVGLLLVLGASAPSHAQGGDPLLGPRRPELGDLKIDLNARLESKVVRSRNEVCTAAQRVTFGSNCFANWLPGFDFQVTLASKGSVADRVFVDVQYDSQNQFDASNNISLFYTGKPNELLQHVEVGNVSFRAPTSRFLTAGIPSNNYGLQASGQVGPMFFETIEKRQGYKSLA